ncbi:MAG: hypothetical protein EA417_21340 [Gammaproteobacteria bacterium]|nr:MAG: hypothetical protein EA417_21340 [Gammaproteobacteria bacterium]
MLDEVWPRYAGVLDRLESGVEVLSPAPETVIGRVAELLDLRGALPDGTLVVALPAEMAPERRELAMAHEFLDAYHHVLSEGVLVDDGSVGALVLSEGVAMYATRALFPDVSDARHLGGEQGWVEACHGRIDQVLTDAMTGES